MNPLNIRDAGDSNLVECGYLEKDKILLESLEVPPKYVLLEVLYGGKSLDEELFFEILISASQRRGWGLPELLLWRPANFRRANRYCFRPASLTCV